MLSPQPDLAARSGHRSPEGARQKPGGALADGTRQAIVARLADAPMAVGQLAAGLQVSRPAVPSEVVASEHDLPPSLRQ
jgi:hypothetical protein